MGKLLGPEDVRKLKATTKATHDMLADAGEVHRLACNILFADSCGTEAVRAANLYKAAIAADHALAHDLSPNGVPEAAWDNLAKVAASLALLKGDDK